jgi:hypothetical protein
MEKHPITPPPELVQQWVAEYAAHRPELPEQVYIAARAAQWGADQELEACCQWISDDAEALRIARRPKLPSLAEEALDELYISNAKCCLGERSAATIRRALERLQELEGNG